ncbi:MAG: UvrD-helicase domain-containing protein, partial [Actinomycetota bacterium]|nr:UvrD-helicase domain-containing protein [Actinomycetota bacterium]
MHRPSNPRGGGLHDELRGAAFAGPLATDGPTGATVVLRQRDVVALAVDPRLNGIGLAFFDLMGIVEGPLRDWYGRLMFTNEGDYHRRMRSLVSRAFTPRAVEQLREPGAEMAAEAVAGVKRYGGDLVDACSALATRMMCRSSRPREQSTRPTPAADLQARGPHRHHTRTWDRPARTTGTVATSRSTWCGFRERAAGRGVVVLAWFHAAVTPAATRPTLVPGARPAAAPLVWDSPAERVLAHDGGLLRVLGGPGTGKTTVLLESVLRRLHAGTDPERVLVLVGSRRAADELRMRMTRGMRPEGAGLGVTVREPLVRTVHSYAFGLLRLHAARQGAPPPRLLASADQDAVVRELLAGELAGDVPGLGWPDRLRPAMAVPGFAAELRELLLRAAERGLGPADLTELGRRLELPEWVASGRFFLTYEQVTLLRGAAGSAA